MYSRILTVALLLFALPASAKREQPITQSLERRIEAVTRILEPHTAGEMAAKCARTDALLFDGESAYNPTESDLIDAGMCSAYFASMLETLEAFEISGVQVPDICEPNKGLTGPLIKDAFMKFLDNHPNAKDSPTVTVALAAWAEYYPCRR
jgi:hypothetical protein